MATSIIITSTKQNGEKRQRSVTSIDPSATANQLIEFSGKLTALSTDSYVQTERVDKTTLAWTEANNDG